MNTDTKELTQLVLKRLGILERLWAISKKQLDGIRDGGMEVLFDILARKQSMLHELETVERALDPYRATPPDQRLWDSEEEREKCRQLIANCETMLKRILQCDRTSEQEMIARKSEVEEQLKRLDSARVTSEYVRQTTRAPKDGDREEHRRFDMQSR